MRRMARRVGSRPAAVGARFGFDIGGKEAGAAVCLNETDEPSVYILPVYLSGPGLAIKRAGGGGGEPDGVLYGADIFRRKAEAVFLQFYEKFNLLYR